MKKTYSIFLTVILLIVLASCSSKDKSVIFIDYATEETLEKYISYDEFIDDENGTDIIIWSEKIIKKFNFIKIGYEQGDGNGDCFQEEILYSTDQLSPEKPLVVKTVISEGFPTEGISYTDASGKERYFSIQWSGRDGSLSLKEFKNKGINIE